MALYGNSCYHFLYSLYRNLTLNQLIIFILKDSMAVAIKVM